jgi:hypothetical protein
MCGSSSGNLSQKVYDHTLVCNKEDHYHKKDKDGRRMVKIKISQESC